MQCANCETEMEKNGLTSPGNTPEMECPSCGWDTTRATPSIRPEHQGLNLSMGKLRRLWSGEEDLEDA